MGGIFSKPKSPAMPPVPPPPALPEAAEETEDDMARRMQRRKGFKSTILTGAVEPGKKSLLG